MMNWIKNISTGANVITVIFYATTGLVAMFVALNRLRKWCGKLRKEKDPSKQERRSTVTERQKSVPAEVRRKPKGTLWKVPKKSSKKNLIEFAHRTCERIERLEEQLNETKKSKTKLFKDASNLMNALREVRQERDDLKAEMARCSGYSELSAPITDCAPTPREVERAVNHLTKGMKTFSDAVGKIDLDAIQNGETLTSSDLTRRYSLPFDIPITHIEPGDCIDAKGLIVSINRRTQKRSYIYVVPNNDIWHFGSLNSVFRYMRAVRTHRNRFHNSNNLSSPTPEEYISSMNHFIEHGVPVQDIS